MADEPQLTDQTKAELELGRKMAAQNAAAYERALKSRAAETSDSVDEVQAAVDEALQREQDKTKPHKGDRK